VAMVHPAYGFSTCTAELTLTSFFGSAFQPNWRNRKPIKRTPKQTEIHVMKLSAQESELDELLKNYPSWDEVPEEILDAYDRIRHERRLVMDEIYTEEDQTDVSVQHFIQYHCTPRTPVQRVDVHRRSRQTTATTAQARRALPACIRRVPRNRAHRATASRPTTSTAQARAGDSPGPSTGDPDPPPPHLAANWRTEISQQKAQGENHG